MRPAICNFFPKPDLLETDHLLCIQPHPDDLEIGAGATVSRMRQTGTKVSLLTVTDGSAGVYDSTVSQVKLTQTRKAEVEKAAAILGIEELIWLDHKDGGYLPYEAVRAGITRNIRKLKPTTIMVCDPWLPYEAHSDHIRTGMAAAEAGFLSGMPYFCPADKETGLSPHNLNMIAFYFTAYPNTFIDATATWTRKLSAIDCHKSQFSGEKGDLLKNLLKTKARQQAEGNSCEMVESFKVLSPRHLHIFEVAWQC
ncbi:MAG: PIG-L deacetylase family protein [Bacillota bacterium]